MARDAGFGHGAIMALRVGPAALALAAHALVAAPGAAAEPAPDARIAQTAVILPSLGGAGSKPVAVGAGGHIVGQSQLPDGRWRATLWKQGVARNLGTVGGHTSHATRISPGGRVIGRYWLTSSRVGGFVWYDGTFTDLGTLGGDRLEPIDVDTRGRVTGTWTATNGTTRGFVRQSGRTILLPAHPDGRTTVTGFFAPDDWILGTAELTGGSRRPVYWKALTGGRWSAPHVLRAPSHDGRGAIVAITDERHFVAFDGPLSSGSLMGRHGYLSRRGEIVPVAAGSWSSPVALSSSDVVVGHFGEGVVDGGYIWNQAAGSRPLPALATGDDVTPRSLPAGINDRGQVVGTSRTSSGYAAVAWCGEDIVDLQGGGTVDAAIAVTASGFVLGQVSRDGVARGATWRLSTACAAVLP